MFLQLELAVYWMNDSIKQSSAQTGFCKGQVSLSSVRSEIFLCK